MNDAQLIHRWQRCEQYAGQLGMIVTTNATSLLSVAGDGKKGSFPGFHTGDSVNELLGYLEGLMDAKDKLGKKLAAK